ncbi:MAG: hypothetical protein FRX49_09002 [Trebouxia sp. A1-2]|nr:MAG: hypothetical protein FRX49_09002 [Trebouxia sp. A1-2]
MAFQFNYQLLKQTLMSYKLAKVHNIIVLDNSLGRHAIGEVDTLKSTYGVAQVIEMPFSMYFTELQNLMAFMARQTHLPLYYWSHMDVMALPHSDRAEDAMGMRMSHCAEQASINNASWGVIFNTNDYLSANKLEAFDSCGGYDTYVTTYTADCDFYARMRGNGYITVDCNVGYIFDATLNNASVTEAMNAPIDQVSWQRKKELMEDMAWRKSKSRGAWREADFTDADRAAWWPLSEMGQKYYSTKFRGKECDAPAEGFIQFDRVAVPLAQVQANNQELLDKYTKLYTDEVSPVQQLIWVWRSLADHYDQLNYWPNGEMARQTEEQLETGQADLPDAAPPKADDAPGVAAAPKPGDPIWALLPNPPGVAGAPNTAPGVLGVPKAAPGDAGTPKPPPGDPNAFPGVAPVPNAAVGVEGFAKPA